MSCLAAIVLAATVVITPLCALAQKGLARPTSTTTTAPLSGDDSSAIARAQRLVNGLRSGDVDRSQLSATLNAKLSPAALQQAIAQVRALGPTTTWTLSGKTTTANATTYALEVFAGPTRDAQVRAEQRSYGNLPLIVLSAGVPDPDEDPVAAAQQRAVWEELGHVHERIAALSSRGVHRVVAGSGHGIPIERPAAVTSAIDEVVDQARSR